MADPYSFRSFIVLCKPAGNEASIAVSDFDSRKHVMVAPPAGAPKGWKPPIDNAPLAERILDEEPVDAPSAAPGEPPLSPDEHARMRLRMGVGSPGASKQQKEAEARTASQVALEDQRKKVESESQALLASGKAADRKRADKLAADLKTQEKAVAAESKTAAQEQERRDKDAAKDSAKAAKLDRAAARIKR